MDGPITREQHMKGSRTPSRIRPRWHATTCSVAVTLLLVACGEATPATSPARGTGVGTAGVNLGAPTEHISATGQLQFSPSSQTAHVGDVIEWTNTGSVEHTVTFDAASAVSDPSLMPGATWEVKFTTSGTYTYHCTIHSGMNGTIVVS